ncbi:hypothetical protein DSL92_02765 [Billgrantia gudaonensis]|uniref:Uncharacterized protein n=1 Tax=Billgrantia gudaonensis TaxID=376427 RepID=A0A432JLE3_9GAMM|nr:hypothetical protein DSL92_02765 [Halomonas gudaonensis]
MVFHLRCTLVTIHLNIAAPYARTLGYPSPCMVLEDSVTGKGSHRSDVSARCADGEPVKEVIWNA